MMRPTCLLSMRSDVALLRNSCTAFRDRRVPAVDRHGIGRDLAPRAEAVDGVVGVGGAHAVETQHRGGRQAGRCRQAVENHQFIARFKRVQSISINLSSPWETAVRPTAATFLGVHGG